MTYLTPEATQRLDTYLADVRSALAGCPSVDADEIEQDICAHIAAEFPPDRGPVSALDMDRVLARLGRPDQWVPEGEQSPLWRTAERVRHLSADGWRALVAGLDRLRHLPGHAERFGRLALAGLGRLRDGGQKVGAAAVLGLRYVPDAGRRVGGAVRFRWAQGPEDWRLAYWAFGLLVFGLIIPPLLIGLLPASYCAARAAVAVAQERGESLGPRRWLVYPPLVLVNLLAVVVLFLWPLAPAGGIAHSVWHHAREDVLALIPLPESLAEVALFVYAFAAGLGLWWVVLGTVLTAVPRLFAVVFRPFADGFGRRQAGTLVLTGLGIVAVCVGLLVRVMNSENNYVHAPRSERPSYVAYVDVPRR